MNPYPQPAEPPAADLGGGGFWHVEGFIGAILTGEAVVDATSGEEQRERVRAFS